MRARAMAVGIGLAIGAAALAAAEETPLKRVERGIALWLSSCPLRQPLCLKPAPRATASCGVPGRTAVLAVPRQPGKAAAAQRLFAGALAADGPAGAAARFYRAESELHDFLLEAFPKELDLTSRRSESLKAFARFLESKAKRLARALASYQALVALKDPVWSIAARARIAQLYHHFADALAGAPVPLPPSPRGLATAAAKAEFARRFSESYCEALRDKASPLEAKAREAYEECDAAAVKLGVEQGEWAELCRNELARLKRERFVKVR